ncbi:MULTISPECIES: hypothetical protein [unclassified Mesorhizobium]|uniref:hypothetical protein n=1 Tax=unclassified Mesorhizobium TaxID=325217 RepID=UPI000BAF961A|nr:MULTISPECIES: hypothetical protein [unclassified Mesorhizobium]AZO11258.1 hypothetical protein EJ074_20800 [Mesorhizobium sp. M3A.F.Ca.ET.080.04.2.1]PBB88491.1 hypothetical protein CK216_01815 [Mesorhizobium sp. WSM3876]RWB76576.1 MAG: hypothetical protein EOQ49_01815 [Mesorhizobium sp.]RWB92247.1 MAG: hypothetical protein EOQ52_01715 [Mesorhizobium sp.]RWE27941.1 MAG: hypothetical protein EOS41_00350 [Mesorhizobium sp.]
MFAKVQTADMKRRAHGPELNDRRPKLSLRQRASDHPMAMFMLLGATAFSSMLLAPAAGPAFASINPPANVVEGASTTLKTARLPQPAIEFACKGQNWGAESAECLRAIAEQSGQHRARAVRMIANAAPLTNTPNIF